MRAIPAAAIALFLSCPLFSQENREMDSVATNGAAVEDCGPPPSGLVGWWPGDGDVRDLVGTLDGFTSGTVTYPQGKIGKCFEFDGVEDYVQIPHSSSISFTGSFTAVLWVKLLVPVSQQPGYVGNPTNADPLFFDKSQGSWTNRTYRMFFTKHSNTLWFSGASARDGSIAFTAGVPLISSYFDDLEWHFIVGVWDRENLQTKIYIDGVERGTNSVAQDVDLYPTTTTLKLGGYANNVYPYLGSIDEFQLYNRALTQAEVEVLWCGASEVVCKGLMLSTHNISFGDVTVGSSTMDTLTVSTEDTSLAHVTNIVSLNPDFSTDKTSFEVPSGHDVNVLVGFQPTSLGEQNSVLLIFSDRPNSPDTIRVSGNGTPVPLIPVLDVTPKHLALGDVPIGATKDTTVEWRNVGNDTLRITNVFSSRAEYSVSHTSALLLLGQSLIDTITFAPTTLGAKDALIFILSNAPSSPDTLEVTATASVPSGVEGDGTVSGFWLGQNHPNPFNPETVIEFSLSSRSHAVLTVHNLLGETVATLVNEDLGPGRHRVVWNAADLPSGIYFTRLNAGQYVETRKGLLMK